MSSIDLRTRFEGDVVALDPDEFLDAVAPPLVAAYNDSVGQSAPVEVTPLTLDVDGALLTFAVHDRKLTVGRGGTDGLVVALGREAFSDLVQDVASTFGVQMTGRAEVRHGPLDAFVEWEPMLRSLLDGRPHYEPGTIAFCDRDGGPLDLRRPFTLDSAPEEVGHFLAEAGFLHLRGVFDVDEMAAVSAELDAAIAVAEREDGASWWACTEAGEWYPARILGFNHQSPTLRALLHGDRFTAIGRFTDDDYVQRDPDNADSAEGLLKKVGVREGISDVSWHKDCSMGGHSRGCCGLVVGISLTGAGRENGELGVVPGSHRANIPPLGVEGLDLARLALPTETGDVTVHCSCTLHMSRPPVSAERRVVYTGFVLAPRIGDHRAVVDPAEARRERAAYNDHTRRAQREQSSSARTTSHDL